MKRYTSRFDDGTTESDQAYVKYLNTKEVVHVKPTKKYKDLSPEDQAGVRLVLLAFIAVLIVGWLC